MEDKLEQFYNSIKSNPSITGLPKDYATFKSAMADSNISAEFFKAIKQNPSITGLPEDYNTFSSALGLQKKNLIGSESTSGSEPFQDKMLGGGVKINPFQPISAKPIESTKFNPSVIRNIAARGDKKLSSEAAIKTMTSNIAATPRYVYDWTKLAVEKAASLASPTGETGMVLPTFDQVREMTRSSEPNALNSLDYLDKLSKTAAADAEALSQKISTNKLSYIDLFKEGKFGTFIDKTANDLILSAPSMALMTVSPAAAATAFGAGRNLELTDNDTLPADLRLTNSFFTGLSEVFLEGKIGGTALLKNITMQAFKEGGEKAAKEVVNKATRDIMAKYAKKMYGASKDIFLSGVEEATTDFIQQVTDYYTGLSDKIDLTRTMEAAAGGLAAGTGIKALGETVIKPTGKAYKKIKNLNTKASAISQDLDNPNIPNETKSVLQDELIKTNEEAADVAEAQKNTITNLTPTQQKSLDAIAVDMGNMEALLEDPNLSPETKATFQTKLDELQAKADAITSKGESIEYVSEGDNFFKILLDGTKEPVTEAEFDQAVSTPKPINEKNGDMVTVNFGGKAITGTVEVDEGGKASIYSGGVVYELPNDTEYVDYASPVRISDTDGSIEFDGVSYPEVRIESMNGTETVVLIDENGKPKTVKDPKIVEEFKYQITLANLAEITEEEAITLLSEYEQDSKTKVDDATEGGVNQADEQKRSEEDIKLQEAIDEIDLIELIALEELDNADANAKLVEYKPTNSKDTKVYLVKKNADGTVSATLDGKKVRRGAVLTSLSEVYDLQSKEGSKKLATKLQEQVNALKADVEAKLFGKAAVTETPVGDFDSYDLTPAQKKLAETYKSRITQLKESDPEQYWSVDVPSDEVIAEASKNDMITDAGGGMGIVTEDGNVIGVFKYDQSKKGTSAVILSDQAKKGAIKLDNFDTYLTKQYEKSGYRVVSRVPFNEEFAPEGWNKEAHGTPDVVMMIYDPNNQLNIEEKRFENPETGYEDAMNYRDSFVDQARENLKTQEDAIKESSQQVTQGGEQGSSVQRQRADEGQQKAGERKGDERKAEKPKADRGDSIKQSREEQEKVTPKKDDSKPTGLSPLETKFKETPEALSKDELKEVLDTKRERYKKAMATIEKGDLEGDALKAKQKAVESLENTIEDLVKRIDAGVVQKIATKDQAIGSESIPVKNQPKTKRSLDGLKTEFSNNKVKMKVIEAVEKGISVLQSAFPSMNIVIHKSSSDFLEATGLPMINGKVPSGVFMYNGDANVGYEGTIHINLTNANPTVVYHEIAHALMLKTLGENKAMFDSFKNKVSKILSEKTAANLDAFIEPYPEFEKSEEYIVQLVAALAATKSNTNPSILMKLKVIINDLVSKITGGKITVFGEEAEGIEVYNFLKQMAETIKEGRDINTLQESFNDNLFEPTELDITGIAPDDIPASGRYPRAKEFRGDYEMVDHPIITNKILKGKPIAVTMSDHTKVGVYKNDKSGVEYSGLMGGVFYPYIKGIRNAGLGWASVTTKAARSLVANALNTDYTVVYRMARATGSIGNVNFGDIAFLELTAPVTNNKVSEKRFLSELNSQLSKVKAGVNFLEEYGVNGKVTSIASLKKGLDKMSFSARGNFWKVVMKGSWNKKSTGSWYQFLEKYNVASLEDIVNGLAETEVDTALDHDVVAVLKLAKPEYTNNGIIKIYTTRKELVNEKKGVFFIDAPNHPSYPYVVKGEPVGVLNEFNNISEYFPVIKKWIESKRLNSPYKAVETMGKELISSRISELESQLKTSKEFIKKYKDDLFSKSLGVAKTPEQMVQAMKEDIKFFNAIVDFAYLSIKLRGLKTIEAFKAELEKQLGVKFDKMPQELKDVWNEAKKRVVDEKKQAPTVKQTIKEATEQKTSPEKVATFAEYMAAKYKGMAEGEKIGQKNRFEIIKEAARYVKQAVASDVSRAKINSLINKAISIQNFDSVKSFAKYVDKLIENQEYYAKVAELEGLAAKIGKALRAEKFGSINPQISRLLSINPENLTESGIDAYIALANDLLSSKVANVANLESTLTQLKSEERNFIEGKLAAGLIGREELVKLLDKINQLSEEKQSSTLTDAKKLAIAEKRTLALKELTAMLDKKRAEIMEFISGNKTISNAKDYTSLLSAIKKYNRTLDDMVASEFISEDYRDLNVIDLNSKQLTLLEEALKEKLDKFRTSLTDQIKNIINSTKNQYETGGIRAKLFDNLSDFEKKIYDPIIKDVLTIPLEILPDLDIADLNVLFNAVEQLNNGYISPKLMESIEIIEAKAYQNTIAQNANKLYDAQVGADGVYKNKLSPIASSVSEFKSWSELADFMKMFNYQDIKTAFTDGFAQIFGEYILTPVQKSLVRYKILFENTISPIIELDDDLESFFNYKNVRVITGKPSTADVVRNVLGIFFIQADHFRHEDFDKFTADQKDLAKYLLGEYNKKNLNVSRDRMDLLKEAYSQIDGDISTKQGLQDAMDKYFAKNPRAKKLFYAIRNSINNEIAPMNKISIERDGGSFENDNDYFQWQKVGENVKDLESNFQDLIQEKYNKDFKRKANATYKRKGSPFFMREFDATKAYYKMAEEAVINYEVEPVIIPFKRAVEQLANKYKLEGKDNLAMFLQASNEYVFFSAKLMFEKYQSDFFNKLYSSAASFIRRYRLGNIIRTLPDLGSTESKLALSMDPVEYAKYLAKQAIEFNDDSFLKLAELVSSPIQFKVTRANVENMQFNKPSTERRLDALTGLADRVAQTTSWKAFMMANFKKISGKELDVKEMVADPLKYYIDNKYALDKAGFLSDQQIDTYTVNQFDLGRAPTPRWLPALTVAKVIPFMTKEKAVRMLTVNRNSKKTIYLNFMGAYTGTEANLLSSAFQKIAVQKDYIGGFRDIASIMTSQFMYMSYMAAANAIASVIGFALTNMFDGDDEDEYAEIMKYAQKEWEAFSELYQDPVKLMQTYLLTLALTPLAKYPTLSRSAVAIGVGLWSGAEIGSAQNKAESKEVKNKWESRYKVIGDKLYVNPIPFGVKDPKLTPTWGEYANMLDPISGFYLKLADDQLNPKRTGNVISMVNELNKDGEINKNKMYIAGANLFMLGTIGYGNIFAPTYIKIMNEKAKSQLREDMENKKKGGKSNQTKNPFGSSGFGSGGLKGGL